ncbi:MAG: IPT/TIG domain-containing protein [Solirubrobacteraceae bacterium]
MIGRLLAAAAAQPRGVALALFLTALLTALTMVMVIAATALGATDGAAAIAAPKARSRAPGRESAISLVPSTTKPYYACPAAACEAIIDPRPLKASDGYALPQGGPPLEGSGEMGGFDPQDLQSAYKIPTSAGSAQTVALIDAYGYKAAEADLAKYRARYGLPACTKADGCFKKVNEKGEEAHYPKEAEPGWEAETALDLDMASAACPQCHILLVQASTEFAPDTAQSVNTAAALGATEISNSYGYPEEYEPWCGKTGCAEYSADYHHPGVVVLASAGDSGYEDDFEELASPNFPATSPYVVAVGGTSLQRASNSRGWSESVWNEPERAIGTGSGCSKFEPKPAWQTDTGCAKRTDNDISADAACETPVSVYSSYFGGWEDLCGTSVSSPLVAGIVAHANAATRALAAEAYYENPGSLFDVTRGSNGACPTAKEAYLCHAEVGYDGPTGLGTPDEIPGALHPSVAKVESSEGPPTGGTSVTITGTNFTGATAVTFGSASAAGFTVKSATSITAVSPAGTGAVDVTVSTPEGTSATSPADEFSYSDTPPEFGRCLKVAKAAGKYKTSACDSPQTGGSYEWMPGVVKTGFTSKGGETTLQALGKLSLACTADSSRGAYSRTRYVANVVITLSQCESSGVKCSSPGSEAGEIVTRPLQGALQWVSKAKKKVALDLYPVGRTGLLTQFSCGGVTFELQGSVLVALMAGKMAVTASLPYGASRAQQKPSEYETTAAAKVKDVLEEGLLEAPFEQAGLTVTSDDLTSEEALEVNAFA